jgi:shikimate kinase
MPYNEIGPGNLFLVGYRCTGKTSVGRTLADLLRRPFVDTDAIVAAEACRAIRDIVSQRGWDYFRDRERSVVRRVCRGKGQVVATGGGVVLDPSNVSAVRRSGWVVWLKCRPATIHRRMTSD